GAHGEGPAAAPGWTDRGRRQDCEEHDRHYEFPAQHWLPDCHTAEERREGPPRSAQPDAEPERDPGESQPRGRLIGPPIREYERAKQQERERDVPVVVIRERDEIVEDAVGRV